MLTPDYLGFGSGKHELEFFIKEIAPREVQRIRSLGFGIQALLFGPGQLRSYVNKFPALEKFTMFYYNADEKAHLVGVDAHKVELQEPLFRRFSLLMHDRLEWKWPQWEMEYIRVKSAAEWRKLKENNNAIGDKQTAQKHTDVDKTAS